MDAFQIWLPKVKNKCGKSEVLYTDKKKEFISLRLKDICNYKGITIKYIAFYIYKEID